LKSKFETKKKKKTEKFEKNNQVCFKNKLYLLEIVQLVLALARIFDFKLSGRQVETEKKPIFLVKKSKKCQKTAILGQKTMKNDISDLATRKFELTHCCPIFRVFFFFS